MFFVKFNHPERALLVGRLRRNRDLKSVNLPVYGKGGMRSGSVQTEESRVWSPQLHHKRVLELEDGENLSHNGIPVLSAVLLHLSGLCDIRGLLSPLLPLLPAVFLLGLLILLLVLVLVLVLLLVLDWGFPFLNRSSDNGGNSGGGGGGGGGLLRLLLLLRWWRRALFALLVFLDALRTEAAGGLLPASHYAIAKRERGQRKKGRRGRRWW